MIRAESLVSDSEDAVLEQGVVSESGANDARATDSTASTSVAVRHSDLDILEELVRTDCNIRMVCNSLDVSRADVLHAISANYTLASNMLRSLQLLKLVESLGEAQVALTVALDHMDPDDIGKTYSQLHSAFDALTRPARNEGMVGGGANFNLNLFLQKLPGQVRGNVTKLVDMTEDDFERAASATLINDESEAA